MGDDSRGGRETPDRPRSSNWRRNVPDDRDAAEMAGWFRDGMEVAGCARLEKALPATFPVVHRPDAATLRMVAVARREGSVLLCDNSHDGDHLWPTGDLAGTVQSADPTG